MDKSARHAQLSREIEAHDHAYYVLDSPRIDDRAYDALFAELKQLERDHPDLVHPASPTQRVGGAPREGAVKVKHEHAMFSLDNTYDTAQLQEFDRRVRDGLTANARVRYVVEPKLDGASLTVSYREGQLVLGATRGDGQVGEDITQNIRTMRAIPLRIAERRPLTVRGEVVIYKRDFIAVNEERQARGDELFANPRNTAAGWLRLLDARETAARPLRAFFYDMVERYQPTHVAALEFIAKLGLPTHGLHEVCDSLDDVCRFITEFDQRRVTLPYETDGIVVKVDSLEQRDLLGNTSRFPRWAVAYKFAAERVTTRVLAIECDVGRSGALTPVGTFEPVAVGGSVVAHASLHNIDYIAERDIRVGDSVVIEKAGEVIPQVINVQLELRPEGTKPWQPPEQCPVCKTQVARTGDEAALRCPNPSCPGRLRALLFYFTRRTGMDVDRLGWSLIEQLVEANLVRDVADIFALPEQREQLLQLPRMGEKSCDNLLLSIEAAKQGRTFSKLLTALGIPLLGAVAAKLVAERYTNLQTLLATASSDLRADLAEVHGIGPKIVDSLIAYLESPEQRAVLEKLLRLGVVAEEPKLVANVVPDGPLNGLSFCVTGVLTRPREVIHETIRNAGGEIHDRVKKGTTYLVAGEKVGDAKRKAAQKHGTLVIDEAKLAELLAP